MVTDAHTAPTRAELFAILETVLDPEVPVLDVVEMGIVRDARVEDGRVHVDITPTYSGCPAMREIEEGILGALAGAGYDDAVVHTVFREPWTTDWMTDGAREKLRAYGIAPPEKGGAQKGEAVMDLLPILQDEPDPVPCPFCGSRDTRMTSAFGSTACKALHYCDGCEQPFEHFKCI